MLSTIDYSPFRPSTVMIVIHTILSELYKWKLLKISNIIIKCIHRVLQDTIDNHFVIVKFH